MFFTKTNDSSMSDPVFDIVPNFKYFAKTKKFLKMQRIFIKSRTEVLGDSENNQCIPNSYTLKQAGIPLQYRTEGIKSLIYLIIVYIVILINKVYKVYNKIYN